jgi:hypothetical protein
MSKRLIIILALAFVVGLCLTAYAEVQNVKVSGDLLFRAISRNNFMLSKEGDHKYKVGGLTMDARVRVDADLTDNVSTTVRLLNERQWGKIYTFPSDSTYGAYGLTENDKMSLDLAYVTLKEFLYSPLTLVVGRQELKYGNALVIGDPDTNIWAANTGVPWDLSLRKSFDSVRAILDYNPLVVDLIYAKINESDVFWMPSSTGASERNDQDLYGINAAYDLSAHGFKGKLEGYMFSRIDRLSDFTASVGKKDTCYTVGALLSGQATDHITGSLEGAYQFGNRAVGGAHWDVNSANNIDRSAWALQMMANYAFKTKYAPNLGLGYTYLSGDKETNKKYTYWDSMFSDQTGNNIVAALLPASNCQVINAIGNMKPTDDLTLELKYGYYMLAQKANGSTEIFSPYGENGTYDFETTAGKKSIGHALDVTATYDYTEDVQLGLTFGYFNPGSAFNKSSGLGFKQNATQLIGSMKVTF